MAGGSLHSNPPNGRHPIHRREQDCVEPLSMGHWKVLWLSAPMNSLGRVPNADASRLAYTPIAFSRQSREIPDKKEQQHYTHNPD